jgi:DNA excision repair protein ERCC-3
MPSASNPLIIQSDSSLLLETNNPLYEEVRDYLVLFAELVKSPEHIHTYRLTPLSLWNAAAAGISYKMIVETLGRYTKYAIPENVLYDIKDYIERYGKLRLVKHETNDQVLLLVSDDALLLKEIGHNKHVKPYLQAPQGENAVLVKKGDRGLVKQVLIKAGFPVDDQAGYATGDPFAISLRPTSLSNRSFSMREYQQEAVDSFYANGSIYGGSGAIVLPCGAGKTIVAMGVMDKLKTNTLILVTNITAARQWIDELLDKTTIGRDDISEYSGEIKGIKPVTIATYQILTYRKEKKADFAHFNLFDSRNWGLIIYDEVHLLPAPVFRMAAHLQAKRRLGLTATLVREDHKEDDVFSLIGPKKYDVPWKVLEKQGWIAKAVCTEIKVDLPKAVKMGYTVASDRNKFTIASTNPDKLRIIQSLIAKHKDDNILIIGQYLDQLEKLSEQLKVPIITGKTRNNDRIELYRKFKTGELKLLIVSKVANFAVDLPEANVAIQISGTFGSRQEEAQRLGRILRPKSGENMAHFYSVITKGTVEEDFALKRQLFLAEQGYKYLIVSM